MQRWRMIQATVIKPCTGTTIGQAFEGVHMTPDWEGQWHKKVDVDKAIDLLKEKIDILQSQIIHLTRVIEKDHIALQRTQQKRLR